MVGGAQLSHQPLGTRINFWWRGRVHLCGSREQQGSYPTGKRREISKHSDSSVSRRLGSREDKDPAQGSLDLSDLGLIRESLRLTLAPCPGLRSGAASSQGQPTARQCRVVGRALDWEPEDLTSSAGSATNQLYDLGKVT